MIRKYGRRKISDMKRPYLKNNDNEVCVRSNNTDFIDKYQNSSNSGGFVTSSCGKCENHPIKGYPYKRGVKLAFDVNGRYEFSVEAGGGDDLYGICV
ncbi:hypothetical protein Q7M_3 [Borrelia crocidurae str. Achema]|uniref:Uncharacterized protein n=1 Tax=Borrelia crocidurae (strain Achema) TaxID=1155096 RepID=I0FBC6_BORCA|nr:hypothetical protein Q7M_3 [Borrelia crocidurae str. Achema]